jgi:hypothetical protein
VFREESTNERGRGFGLPCCIVHTDRTNQIPADEQVGGMPDASPNQNASLFVEFPMQRDSSA